LINVEVIKTAVDALVKHATGWHSLEYSEEHHQQLVMQHAQHGFMPVDMLSDGLRNTIAMVADLAFRAYKLNPHLGARAALETPGVALIDEVDMFLHPSWQQSILPSLCAAFPQVQFIVSTHSPQVLTTVASESVRILRDGKVYAAPAGTEGAEPGRLLTTALGLQSVRPPHSPATQELLAYLALGRGHYFSRAELLGILWPERMAAMTAGSFNTALWRLRRMVEHPPHRHGQYIASVHYSGSLREEEGSPQAFDEIWHLAKPTDGNRGWVLAGIQQLS
jgi:hypothetical protein